MRDAGEPDGTARRCIEQAAPLISPRTGVITGHHELRIEPDDARLFYAFTRVTSTSRYGPDWRDCYQQNGGAGPTSEIALAAAIGETLERYACSVYDQKSMLLGSWEDLDRSGLDALRPDEYPMFSERQYSQPGFLFRPFTETTLLRWIPGWSLRDRRERWVPATVVYIPYRAAAPEEMVIDSVSTGLACALDPWDAILSGLHEAVERDAVMITWLNRLPVPRVDPATDPTFQATFDRHFAGSGAEYMLFDITLDLGVPVYFGVAVDTKHEGLFLASGAAANLDPRRAATKALVEAAQGRVWLKYMQRSRRRWEFRGDYAEIRTFEDHVKLFGLQSMRPEVEYLLSQPLSASLSEHGPEQGGDAREKVERIVRGLAAAGLDAIVVDVTPPDVAAQGFIVTKVLVPGLQPLNADHRYRVLGPRRLYDVPVRTGYRASPLDEEGLSSTPHPFP